MRNLTKYGIDLSVARAYAENLEAHIEYVREAGKVLGVHEAQLLAHDASKWSVEEFPYYADWFYGSKSKPDTFEYAWLHHIHHNPHHWNHWLFADGFGLKGGSTYNGALKMPGIYILEMVADWQGASRAYSDTADMTDWLKTNLPKIKLHPQSRIRLYEILSDLGYGDLYAPLDGI